MSDDDVIHLVNLDAQLDKVQLQYEREVKEMAALLPAWFASRMMSDCWSFGLLLITGQTLCISSITAITRAADGTIWLDVDMLEQWLVDNPNGLRLLVSPTSRTTASVNASHVVAAFELADT